MTQIFPQTLRRKVKIILAVTILLLLANSVPILRSFSHLAATNSGFGALLFGVQELLLFVVLFYALTALASLRPRGFRIWVGVLFVMTSALAYFVINFGVRIDSGIVRNVLASSAQEKIEFIDRFFFFYVAGGLLAAVLFYHFPKLPIARNWLSPIGWPWQKEPPNTPLLSRHERLGNLLIIGTLVVLFSFTMHIDYSHYRDLIKRSIGSYSPLNLFPAVADYARKAHDNRTVEPLDIRQQFVRSKSHQAGPVTVVLVIGESARGDRFSLNGYHRDTNPQLSRLANVFSFTNANACNTATVPSVPCILSRRLKSQFSLPVRETSLIGILRHLGFATYWYSMQKNSVPMGLQCAEGELCRDSLDGQYDASLYPYLEGALKTAEKRDSLIVLHTRGSHTSYVERTPQRLAKFKPVCSKAPYKCPKDQLDNAYDNSILYTDHFLAGVIERLADRNAFMIYTADHGESLGERSVLGKTYGHGTPLYLAPRAQIHVPLIFWGSRKFLRSALNSPLPIVRQKLGRPSSHDFVFHSILDCVGASSPLIEKKLSFCR